VCAESVSEKKLNRIFGKITSKSVVAARIVSNTWKYDRGLSHLLHDELHCLDVPQRVQYKLCTTVHRCLQHKAPQCMTDCCIHTSDIARQQHLQSAGCRQLFVPLHRHLMFGCRAFSVAGLELVTRLPARSVSFLWQFLPLPENFCSFYWHTQRIRGFAIMRYINLLLTLSRALSLSPEVRWAGAQSTRDNQVLACNFAKCLPI